MATCCVLRSLCFSEVFAVACSSSQAAQQKKVNVYHKKFVTLAKIKLLAMKNLPIGIQSFEDL
ncbi:MAG: hypothetical protein LBH84_04750, partial [Prevotellaceae bacterium]|nr:hypothetical protein [Prevotellaceae bacterium]